MTAKIPIPVYIAHPTRSTPGNAVRWKAGQRAMFKGKKEVTVITGEPVAHEAAPGVMCIEVIFDEDGKAACVAANSLRLK